MALNFGIEPPQWLQDEVKWARTISSEGTRELLENAKGFQQIKANNLRYQSGLLGLQQQEQALDMNRLAMEQRSEGLNDVESWMKESQGDPVWMVNHPYTKTNPVASQQIGQAQIRAAESLTVKQAGQDLVDFSKRLNALPPDSRAQVRGMTNDPKTGLPTAQKWQALALAEEADLLRQENARRMAAMEAEQSGSVVTTTVGPPGARITTKTVPPKPGSMAQPKTMTLPDGTMLAWMPGATSLHVIRPDNKTQEMSVDQLKGIAKDLKERDPLDETATMISDFLKQSAENQIKPKIETPQTPSAPAATRTTNDPLGLFK